MKRLLLRLGGLALIIGAIWVSLRSVNPVEALKSEVAKNGLPGLAIQFNDAKLVGWSAGKRVWQIDSKKIDIENNRQRAIFEGDARGELMSGDRKIASIHTDKAIFNLASKDLFVPGIADVSIPNGPSLRAGKVYFNSAASKLVCEGGMDASLGAGTVHGQKMTIDLINKDVTISKVVGKVRLEENGD